MKKSRISIIILCSLALLAGKSAWAKDANSTTDKSVKAVKMALGAWRGSQLMNINVYTSDGDHVGAVADIVGDVKGQVIYVILSHGGFLGIGDKLIPLPWELLVPGKRTKSLEIQLSKKDLQRAPNFDSNYWPDFTQSEWKTKTKKYYESFGKVKQIKSQSPQAR
jgi:sporulation protein YlmC with PRC-barrel domain